MTTFNSNILTPSQRFWRLLKPDQKEITNVYIYSIFNGLVNLSLPLGIQAIVNLIQGGQMSTSWIVMVGIVVFGVALSGMFQIYQLKISESLQQKIFTRAAFEFSYRIPRVRMEALYRHYAPELMNRFFDIISVQKGLSKILIDFSSAGIQVIFGLLLLSFYHPFFILFSLFLLIVVFVIIKTSIPQGIRSSLDESKNKYRVAHWLEEVARTVTTFKLAGNSKLPLDNTDKNVNDYLDSRNTHFKVLVRHYSILVIFKVLVATGLLAIGGVLVMQQHMNIGQFVAAEIIILLVMSSVEKLILSIETIYDVLTSLEKIGQVTELGLDQTEGQVLNDSENWTGLEVEFSDVVFHYPEHNKATINDLSLKINPGERVILKGPNASGKSTLLQLIAGLYTPQHGNISYNGINFAGLRVHDLHSRIGNCITQEQLFEGTLLENITIGREGVTRENVDWAVKNLKLVDFIKKLDQGLLSMIEPQGRKLPRSVVQKIILARSIVEQPELLLLEDAFEHLDHKEKVEIIDFLCHKDHAWTLIAISNDEYLSNNVDRTIMLKDGRVSNQ